LADVVIIRSNSIIYSTRVTKIGSSLTKRYSLLILGWNRENVSKEMIRDHQLNIKLFGLRAKLGRPSVIAYLPFFWIWILGNLFWYRPNIVHACDLDTVLPCLLYKMIFRKTLIFDVCDRYAMAHIAPKHRLIYSFVNKIEERSAKMATVLITVADKLLATFPSKPKYAAVIMNCSDDNFTDKKILGKKNNNEAEKFTLVFPGTISKDRGLEIVSQAIKGLDNVELVIDVRAIDEELLARTLKVSNVKYKGLLQRNDALTLTSKSDAMVILYDPQVPNNNFSASNKLFEAMMFGLPIITNVSSDIVDAETECGIIVSYSDVNQIRAAIVRLRDDIKLRKRLGSNGRNAYVHRYNWINMEKKLFRIYEDLLPPSNERN
jgi:glycosyltransferase involved in cell wall biosynthesis